MKLIINLCLIFAFLSNAYYANSQIRPNYNEDDYFKVAARLYKEKKYKDAYLMCERIVFSTQNTIKKNTALLLKSWCYKKLKNYRKAYKNLKRIDLNNSPNELKIKILYEKALLAYLNKDLESSLHQLNQLQPIADSSMAQSSLLLKILINNHLQDWEYAKKIAYLYIKNSKLSQIEKDSNLLIINSYYSKDGLPKLKNERTANRLSSILPGSGQIYAGEVAEGFMGMALTVGTGVYTVYEFLNTYYITGYVVGLGLFQKLYMGEKKRAVYLAKRHNSWEIEKFNNKIKAFFISLERKRLQK